MGGGLGDLDGLGGGLGDLDGVGGGLGEQEFLDEPFLVWDSGLLLGLHGSCHDFRPLKALCRKGSDCL